MHHNFVIRFNLLRKHQEKTITKTLTTDKVRNRAQASISLLEVWRRGSSQAGAFSLGGGARQNGKQSRRPALILFTSYDMMATKYVTIIKYEKVTVKAAYTQKYLKNKQTRGVNEPFALSFLL